MSEYCSAIEKTEENSPESTDIRFLNDLVYYERNRVMV